MNGALMIQFPPLAHSLRSFELTEFPESLVHRRGAEDAKAFSLFLFSAESAENKNVATLRGWVHTWRRSSLPVLYPYSLALVTGLAHLNGSATEWLSPGFRFWRLGRNENRSFLCALCGETPSMLSVASVRDQSYSPPPTFFRASVMTSRTHSSLSS